MNYEVQFDITVPKDIKKEEIEDWIKFELEMQAGIKTNKKTFGLSWEDFKSRCLTLRARGG